MLHLNKILKRRVALLLVRQGLFRLEQVISHLFAQHLLLVNILVCIVLLVVRLAGPQGLHIDVWGGSRNHTIIWNSSVQPPLRFFRVFFEFFYPQDTRVHWVVGRMRSHSLSWRLLNDICTVHQVDKVTFTASVHGCLSEQELLRLFLLLCFSGKLIYNPLPFCLVLIIVFINRLFYLVTNFHPLLFLKDFLLWNLWKHSLGLKSIWFLLTSMMSSSPIVLLNRQVHSGSLLVKFLCRVVHRVFLGQF